MQVITNHLWF